MKLSKFFRDLYTGPDGETWALGRIYSVPILFTGIAAPIIAVVRAEGSAIPLGEVAAALMGTAGAVAAMVAITKNIDAEQGTALSLPATKG